TQGKLWRLPHGNPNVARMPQDLRSEVASWADDLVAPGLEDVPSVIIVRNAAAAPAGFDHVLAFGADPGHWRFYHLVREAHPTILAETPSTDTPVGLPLDSTPWTTLDTQVGVLRSRAPFRLDLTTEPG